jgi:putative two-component system response regulator
MTAKKDKTILIVDDDSMNITILMRILSLDYKILASMNGREAIETAKNSSPDLILLDVIMDEMDGYEVLSVLKNTRALKKIPVIFLSSMDNADDEIKGREAGAAAYLFKPFDRDTLLRLIELHI